MIPQPTVIYGIDVGCIYVGAAGQILARTTFAWARIDHWPEEVPHANINQRDIRVLSSLLREDLNNKRRVAIGVEAPMWIPVIAELQPRQHVFQQRCEGEHPYEWYLQAGAQASVKAVTLCCLLFQQAGVPVRLTTDSHFWSPSLSLCFEGFICGDNLDAAPPGEDQDYLDAFAVALAGWQCYCAPPGPAAVHHHHAGGANGHSASIWSLIAMSCGGGEVHGPADCDVLSPAIGLVGGMPHAPPAVP